VRQGHVDGALDSDAQLLAAISRLGERHQVVLSLRFLADLTTEETAEALGISRNHVAVVQRRALGALRHQLEGGGDG
jgi:RNA polymerase sigma factor (sigma-70 family)